MKKLINIFTSIALLSALMLTLTVTAFAATPAIAAEARTPIQAEELQSSFFPGELPQTVSKDNRLGQPQPPIFMLTQKIIRQICRSYALMG